MKNYIRTCLSLDKETREKINLLTWMLGLPNTKSGVIKEAVKFLYNHIANWEAEEKNNV